MGNEPIAIVGRGCVLPGAHDPAAFWANILAGRCSLTPVPPEAWRIPGGRPGGADPDETRWAEVGGYVTGFAEIFDPTGFLVAPEEIHRLDPMFHWVLHAGRQALQEAGHRPGSVTRGGMVIGNLTYPSRALTDLADRVWRGDPRAADIDPRNRLCAGLPAQFACEALGLSVGGYTVDTACASSLYAIKYACDRLTDGSADFMLSGAVNGPDNLLINHAFRALSALSPTGRSRPFDHSADGLVPSEGAVVVALMRVTDAQRARVPILGVIRGVGLSNDGQAGGLLAPDSSGQVRAMRQAYEIAGIDPKTVTLLECHATGTPVGDGVEVRSIGRVFADSPEVPLGSVKSNLGHLLATAGGAGLLKVLGAIESGIRPPTIGVENPVAGLAETPARLLLEAEPWTGRRRAGISSFAFGGANAHMIVEAWEPDAPLGQQTTPPARPEAAIAITAIGARVADGADTDALREAVLLGKVSERVRQEIAVTLPGLRIPPRDLELAHPQHVLILEAAREAAAGLDLPRERTLVFVGMSTDPELARYAVLRRAAADPGAPPAAALTSAGVVGMMPNLLANRLGAQFDMTGAGVTVCAEQASGLVCLDLAARALRRGEADAALVGAVDMSCEPVHEAVAAALGGEQPTGDAAVVLVLRRLEDAQKAGERVVALIDEENGSVATDLEVGEASATDSPSREHYDPKPLLGAAHAAHGLLCAAVGALAVQHRRLPAGVREDFSADRPRTARASIHSLSGRKTGIGLRGGDAVSPWMRHGPPEFHVYSGKDKRSVHRALVAGRESDTGPARLVVFTDPHNTLESRTEELTRWLASGGPRPPGIAYRDTPIEGELSFVFTNGSASYPGMGAETALAFPAAADAVASHSGDPRPTGVMAQIGGAIWLARLHAEISRTTLGLRPTAAIGYSSGESAALFALGAWQDPDEFTATLIASGLFNGGITEECTAVREVWRRQGIPGERWANHLITAPADRVRTALATAPAVHLLAILTPESCLLGGEEKACQAVLRRIDAHSVPLEYPIAAHAPEMRAVSEQYRQLHLRPTTPVPGVRFYSGDGRQAYEAQADRAAEGIVAQGIDTVDFVGVIERAWRDGVRVFVEHGPQGQCTGWIRRILGERDFVAVHLDAPEGRAIPQLCQATAELVAAGVCVDTRALVDHLAAASHSGSPHRAGPEKRFPAHSPPLTLPQNPTHSDVEAPAPAAPELTTASTFDTFRAGAPEDNAAREMRIAPSTTVSLDRNAVKELGPAAEVLPETPKTIGGKQYLSSEALSGASSLAGLIERQFQRTSALHQQFLANQARAHSRLLAAMSQLPATTAGRFPATPHRPVPTTRSHPNIPVETLPGPKFDRAQLEHLAEGKVSELLGPEFRPLDNRFRQTRMPMPPLLLADRVTGIDAEKASLGTGRLWTETDIRLDSWYLDAVGRMPPGMMVEAGQADLLLISWLGVDLLSAGDRVYRLLGCEVRFHTSPARPGDTLRFAISIDRHADAEQDGTRLFFFSYDGTIDGSPAMTLRRGQAGFFTDAELAGTAGLIWNPDTDLPEVGEVIAPPLSPARSYDESAVQSFAEGRPAECFGAAWTATRAHIRTPRIGSGPMQLVDRVTELDPVGGPRGGGYLRAQADISPDDWFFACHFKNDPCMPATLMFEAGVQAMQFYLAALGFTVDCDGWRYEPVPEETITLRSRGQIGPTSRLVDYEVFVRELTADPYPTLRADLVATVDGLPAFHAAGMAVRLVPDWPLEHWRHLGPAGIQPGVTGFEISELGGLLGTEDTEESVAFVEGVPQDYAALLNFAWGRMENAFGPRFAPLDLRRVPRLPGPPYHFLSRITAIDGQLGDMRLGSSVTAAYDIPREAWYFTQNSCATMPLAVLMEIALQPCGWLATFVGSTLHTKETLAFRNLDGTLTIHADITPEDRTITTRAELLRASDSDGMIVEGFRVTCVSATGEPVAEMNTTFGFFPIASLENQSGLPPTEAPWPEGSESRNPDQLLPTGRMLRLLDRVTGYWPRAGAAGLGRARAEKTVDPGAWFFQAHFFQDPVQPGSLGVEAAYQLLRWYLVADLGPTAREATVSLVNSMPMTWRYGGQITPLTQIVTIDVEITERGQTDTAHYATALAHLWADGQYLYRIDNLTVHVSTS